jgi:hypothetical protein
MVIIEIENFLRSHSINGEFAWHKGEFDRHFADWKNKLIFIMQWRLYLFKLMQMNFQMKI